MWIVLSGDTKEMLQYLKDMNHPFTLYDSPLVYNFSRTSKEEKRDLRKIFDGSLVQAKPKAAVIVVMNHDTQPGQTVETPIEGFFKPLACSLLLLRNQGYPCVFYGDLYRMKGQTPEPPECGEKLPRIVLARKLFAYGDLEDYVDDGPNCFAFVRTGSEDRKLGLACIMSNADPKTKGMFGGKEHSGEVWTAVLGWHSEEVKIDREGFVEFMCSGTNEVCGEDANWDKSGAEGYIWHGDLGRLRIQALQQPYRRHCISFAPGWPKITRPQSLRVVHVNDSVYSDPVEQCLWLGASSEYI